MMRFLFIGSGWLVPTQGNHRANRDTEAALDAIGTYNPQAPLVHLDTVRRANAYAAATQIAKV